MVPVKYKNDAPWKEAEPQDALDKGNWWEIYNDPALNDLEEHALRANQNLQAALARVEQVRANARISEADQLPRLDFNGSANRQRTSADLSATGKARSDNIFTLPVDLSYEIDLWGRVKRSIEAAGADYQGAAADYQAVLLSLQAEVARSYFSLRTLDSEISLLEQTIKLRQDTLDLVQNRFNHGQVGQLDVSRAETELASTQSEAIGQQKLRNELENALAVLIGKSSSEFSLVADPLDNQLPRIAPGLPSTLLERRPDVAAAERQMAAANARIGIAKTAFFPAISLTGSAGFASNESSSLFTWDNHAWSLGPAISLPIFDAGRNRSNLERARATYDEAIAIYRQQVLVAFQEVENGLNGLQVLSEQAQAQNRAVKAATEALQISEKRYQAGLVSYLEVIVSQRTALQAQRSITQLQGQQFTTSVLLIKALGGGWQD